MGYWIQGFHSGNAQNSCSSAICIKVQLSALVEILKIQNPDFFFILEGTVTGPWNLEMDKVMSFLQYLGVSLAQWTNIFWVVEFHVFPAKDDHL